MTQLLKQSKNDGLLTIPFINLKAQQDRIRLQIDVAIKSVLDHGIYIMGPEVFDLENQLAKFCGVKHAITCSNGTDALLLVLMAKKVGPGDAVFIPSFTFAATAEVVACVGATPVFIDSLEETYNIDPKNLELGIQRAKKEGLNPVGIIPVDLFGQPAEYDAIQVIADTHSLWVMADAAQSFGADYRGRKTGNIGDVATTSFFPAKPLGCYGDGGAVFTNDDDLAAIIKSLRVHGQGLDKYDNVRIGMNGRLDTFQAAILLEKLKIFPSELLFRQQVAAKYNEGLEEIVGVPRVIEGATSAWAQYTIRLPKSARRAALMNRLKETGIPTMVYYVKPLHLQTAYRHYLTATGGVLPVCEVLSEEVLSLPMSGYVEDEEIKHIIETLRTLCAL